MYPVITVPDDAADSTEQLGTKEKFWFRDDSGQRYLFKQGRPGTGEDWAEKVSAELCERVGMPHAAYDLAQWRGQPGVVSRSFVPEDSQLVHGNELLAKLVKAYAETRYYHQTGHTIRRVFDVLRDPAIEAPTSWAPDADINSAAHVFVGYLMLDVLIANTDRHHENWGLIVSSTDRGSKIRLAPSFDHASSLGSHESEQRMTRRMETPDPEFSVAGYAKRAKSALYRTVKDTRPMSTLDAFIEAHRRFPKAAIAWVARLRQLGEEDIRVIAERVPADLITPVAREFAMRLVAENANRIFNMQRQIR